VDNNRLISYGNESIGFWSIKIYHLPGASVILNQYARNTAGNANIWPNEEALRNVYPFLKQQIKLHSSIVISRMN
jgi:hypothetical protein